MTPASADVRVWPFRVSLGFPFHTLAQSLARVKFVESLADCESRFATLQRRVRSLDRASVGGAGSDSHGQQREWQVLVRQFRSLRASLLAHGNVGPLAIRASLWALDVTLRAEDYAECLKSLQGLVQQLLPAHLQQNHLSLSTSLHTYSKAPCDKQAGIDWGREEWISCATEGTSRLDSPGHVTHNAGQPQLDTDLGSAIDQSKFCAVWADLAGLLILYFTCVPPSKQALDVFSILQQLPPPLCQAAEVQFSIRVYAALAGGDIRAYLRMRAETGWRYRQFMNIQLGKIQEYGVGLLCASHRRLARCDALRMVQPDQNKAQDQLAAEMQQLASM